MNLKNFLIDARLQGVNRIKHLDHFENAILLHVKKNPKIDMFVANMNIDKKIDFRSVVLIHSQWTTVEIMCCIESNIKSIQKLVQFWKLYQHEEINKRASFLVHLPVKFSQFLGNLRSVTFTSIEIDLNISPRGVANR